MCRDTAESPLTVWAMMRASTADHDAANRGLTDAARLARSLVNAMFQLKEASHAISVNIV